VARKWVNSADVEVSSTGELAVQTLGVAVANQPGTVVAAGVVSGQALAAFAGRTYAAFINVSDSWVYLNLGGVAVVGQGIPLAPNGGSWEIAGPKPYTGLVNCISTGANKNLCVVEY
jgi:hypothetical protein